jgi:hypothetical protein
LNERVGHVYNTLIRSDSKKKIKKNRIAASCPTVLLMDFPVVGPASGDPRHENGIIPDARSPPSGRKK